ncbi:MAG: DUF5107 domain-containing protein [Clostridia bacterium]|nr:DUF5107 domain-containing protein [Clostridia bacterium]
MSMTTVTVKKLVIPTYQEADAEQLPMFAENRVHQRFTGNPYPNAVVIKTPAKEKHDREYEAIVIENDYIELTILPEIGGKIFTAYDKKNNYDFFYRQHVIKPALIGLLGSWISGGIEFNWPYHHRASTFMPVDYEIVQEKDGVTVWLSEHDPVDRMKGMVGVYLGNDRAIFETRVKVSNRTSVRRSFLWWENTAVPVNPTYEIFFPSDVDHVHFHYRRSNTTYPIAKGHFNGYTFDEPGVDISKHFNTKFPTSYFCAASDYDYFGGYDQGRKAGVVHIGDHHVVTGKKMFTWAYNQLSRSWERALTDTDGAYAELMAGSYTNNQPDLTWLEAYETKCFKQSWYPIAALGVPSYANFDCAIRVESNVLRVQPTLNIKGAKITLTAGGKTILETVADLDAGKVTEFALDEFDCSAYEITIGDVLHYEQIVRTQQPLPELFPEVPYPNELSTAHDLYVAALHFWQYRDPNANPMEYLERAIALEPNFAPALQLLGEMYLRRHEFQKAYDVLERALKALTVYNFHPESGKLNYYRGLALVGLGRDKEAYDAFRKSAWMKDTLSEAMTRAAMLDCKKGDWTNAKMCADTAIENGAQNLTAVVLSAAANYKLGNKADAVAALKTELVRDPLNHLARYFLVVMGEMSKDDFYGKLNSNMSQTCLDLATDMMDAGFNAEAKELLCDVAKYSDDLCPVIAYLAGVPERANDKHKVFPFRPYEAKVYEEVGANYLLGCYHYGDRRYAQAEALFAKGDDFASKRGLALCEYRKGNHDRALELLDEAHALKPDMEEIVYEIAYLLNHLGKEPKAAAEKIKSMVPDLMTTRDDIATEWACAYNRAGMYDEAIKLFEGHNYVPCEGGETALARQYINAWYGKGMDAKKAGNDEEALRCFKTSQILPENLGAGIWHEAVNVPAQYQEALLLEKFGKKDEAMKIYEHINYLYIDYFAHNNLPLLPVYQGLATLRMGDAEKGKKQLEWAVSYWENELNRENSGYFNTTPFFIPFMDDRKEMRVKHYTPMIQTAKEILAGTSDLLK